MVFLSNERRTITGRLGPDKMASGLAQSGACRLIIHLRSELFYQIGMGSRLGRAENISECS